MKACQETSDFLKYVPDTMKTRELIDTVFCTRKNDHKRYEGLDEILQYVPEEMRTEAWCLHSVKLNNSEIQYVPLAVRTKAFYEKLMRIVPNFNLLPSEYKAQEHFHWIILKHHQITHEEVSKIEDYRKEANQPVDIAFYIQILECNARNWWHVPNEFAKNITFQYMLSKNTKCDIRSLCNEITQDDESFTVCEKNDLIELLKHSRRENLNLRSKKRKFNK
jgi:hypothetical protein